MQGRIHDRRHSGFTLVELMIVVAIIGILASIAIPSFSAYQARTRRSEAFVNTSSMARTFVSFHVEKGYYPDTLADSAVSEPTLPVPPASGYGTFKMAWDADTQQFYDIVGYETEGQVWHSYGVVSVSDACACAGNCFSILATGDTDGDGVLGRVGYYHPERDANGNVVASCDVLLHGPPQRNGAPVYDEAALILQGGADLY